MTSMTVVCNGCGLPVEGAILSVTELENGSWVCVWDALAVSAHEASHV